MNRSAHAFRKMNGLGNDFAVLDARLSGLRVDADDARRIADRASCVGSDLVLVSEPSQRPAAFKRILTPDGSDVDACGNGTRCVAALLAVEHGRNEVSIETGAGILRGTVRADGAVT